MKSARRNFVFAIRWIWLVLLLTLVAPQTPAQEEEKAATDQQSVQKAPSNQRATGRQDVKPPRGNNDTKAGPGGSRGSSANATEDKPAPRSNGNNRPGHSGSSSESDRAAPRPSRNAQAGRGSLTNTPAQPASEANAGDPAATVTAKPAPSSPWSGRPAQGGSSTGSSTNKPDTNKPRRSNAPVDASDNS